MATNKRITDVDFIDSLNSNESFFVNQNSAIKQINKSDIIFSISNGGTGATTASGARTNLAITPANIGALSLSGGTMTGSLKVKGIVLTEGTDYGDELPNIPTAGKLFFKKTT